MSSPTVARKDNTQARDLLLKVRDIPDDTNQEVIARPVAGGFLTFDDSKNPQITTSPTIPAPAGATDTGGNMALAAGVGGSTSGAGGVASLTGGAGTAGNSAGGVGKTVGGAGQGSAAGGAAQLTGGAGGATGAGGAAQVAGGAGGATSGTGGAASVTGGAGTAGNSAGGAASVTGGAGQGTAAGGVASVTGGASGAGATGNGGNATVTGGAAASTNGNGGSAIITPGAKAGSGVDGNVLLRGTVGRKTTVTAMTTSATIAVAALLGGTITANQGAAGTATYTMPTGTVFEAALPTDVAVGDSWDFSVTNISTNAAEIVTLAGASGMVAKGNVTVAANNATTTLSFATFRIVREGANTYSFYRV